MPSAADPPPPSAPPAAHSLARHDFVSSDCSVRVRGRIVQHGPPGQIDGIQLELDTEDGLSIVRPLCPLERARGGSEGRSTSPPPPPPSPTRVNLARARNCRTARVDVQTRSQRYPQLVSVRIRPEEQTLWSINSGERLLTLATPLLPPSDDDDHADSDKHKSSSAIDDEDDEDGEGEGADEAAHEPKPTKPTVVTLHEGFLPASEADHLESSHLYSSTFQVLIDGPTFPPPHFDPASLAPPTPAVRPHDGSTGLSSGMLNSPTIQRALLSPLLSPQRRAASQGSDASVPPLSIGLSRTSRASFSAPDRPAAPTNPSTAASRGLAALIAPPSSTSAASSTSTAAAAAAAAAPTLGGTLTGALSSAAKRTAEELVALRRAHDAYVRRAKAELEILEARIDHFDGHVAGKEEGIVRGFRTRDERDALARRRVDAGASASVSRSREREREQARGRTPVADVVEGEAARRSSASGSRERPLSRGRGSVERPSAAPAHAAAAAGSSSSSVPRATNKDEDVSSLIRAQDEREEDQRGRSRSRARRDEAGPPSSSSAAHAHAQLGGAAGSASQRSRSRTKALAEANAKVLEGASSSSSAAAGSASRQGDSTSRERGGGGGGEAGEPGPASASAPGESRGRGRGPRKGENIPATLEEEDEEDEQGGADRRGRERNRDRDGTTTTPRGDPRGSNGFLSPSSAGAGQPTSRGSNGAVGGSGSSTGTTPTFHPAGHALVAIPESEELSVTPSDKGDGPEQPAARSERLGERAQRERQKSAEQDEGASAPFLFLSRFHSRTQD